MSCFLSIVMLRPMDRPLPHLSFEVGHVPRDHRHPVNDGRGSNQRIPFRSWVRHVQRHAFQGHGGVDGERALCEFGHNVPIHPSPQPLALRDIAEFDEQDAYLQLHQGQRRDVEARGVPAGDPPDDTNVSLVIAELAQLEITFVSSRNIRIDRADGIQREREGIELDVAPGYIAIVQPTPSCTSPRALD